MSFGVNDATGYTAYNVGTNHPDDPIIMIGDAFVAGNERAIAYRMMSYDAVTPLSNVTIGIYDITDGTDAAVLIHSRVCQMSSASVLTWAQYNFALPVNLTAGRTYCRAFVLDNVGGNSYIARVAATNYSRRFFSSLVDGVLPNPWGAGHSLYSYNFAIEVITEPSGPEILADGTDLEVENGIGQQITCAGLVSNPVSVAIVYDDGVNPLISVTQADFSLSTVVDGDAVITFTGTAGNLPHTNGAMYSAANYRYIVTCADDSTIEFGPISLLPIEGNISVTAVDPVNDSTSIIPTWITGNASTGDQADHPVLLPNGEHGITLNVLPDFTHTYTKNAADSWPPSVTYEIGYWNSTTQVRYQLEVTVTLNQQTGEGTGLVALVLRAQGLIAQPLTALGA